MHFSEMPIRIMAHMLRLSRDFHGQRCVQTSHGMYPKL
jgi:hypothetical protein